MNENMGKSELEQLLRFIAIHTHRCTQVDVAETAGGYKVMDLARNEYGRVNDDELRRFLARSGEFMVGTFTDGVPTGDGYVRAVKPREFRHFLVRPRAEGTAVLQATRNFAGIKIGRVPRTLLGDNKDATPQGPYVGHQFVFLPPPFR